MLYDVMMCFDLEIACGDHARLVQLFTNAAAALPCEMDAKPEESRGNPLQMLIPSKAATALRARMARNRRQVGSNNKFTRLWPFKLKPLPKLNWMESMWQFPLTISTQLSVMQFANEMEQYNNWPSKLWGKAFKELECNTLRDLQKQKATH